MNVSEQAHAAILLRVAAKTIAEARAAWKRARSDEASLRAAYRACVLAARASQRAADAWKNDPHEYARLMSEARRLDAAATDLKAKLVRAIAA